MPIGIHTHNDGDLAVANTLAAVQQGATQVQGTINGIGERCGNVDLCSVVANLALKCRGYEVLAPGKLAHLTEVSRFVYETANMNFRPGQPFVGTSAFAHKGGCTSTASARAPPATSTSTRPPSATSAGSWSASCPASRTSPRSWPSTDWSKTRRCWPGSSTGSRSSRTKGTSSRPPRRRSSSWSSGSPGASPRGSSGSVITSVSRAWPSLGTASVTEATVKLKIGDVVEHTVSEGDGPVNALDGALRKALERHYPRLREMQLVDYKVRVINARAGTAARVRVVIESKDNHSVWGTVGVSENVIEASWLALVDAFVHKLSRDARAEAPPQPALARS